MQAVPSLVGTGTVIAAAAAGLVIGQVSEDEGPRANTNKRMFTTEHDGPRLKSSPRPNSCAVNNSQQADQWPYGSFRQFSDSIGGPLTSHPTTEFSRSLGAASSQSTPPKAASRTPNSISISDRVIADVGGDPLSSRDSWIKRLSIRPLSQHGSPRSSMAIDSTSLAFSFGSAAPMLGPAPDQPVQPNKLVKRGTTGEKDGMGGTMPSRGSKSSMHSFRRPATSHQRSRTLQQFAAQCGSSPPPTSPPAAIYRYSFECSRSPKEAAVETAVQSPANGTKESVWTSFFRPETVRVSGRVSLGRHREGNPVSDVGSLQRVYFRPGLMPLSYLTKADLPPKPQTPQEHLAARHSSAGAKQSPGEPSKMPDSTETTPSKRPTLATHFSSASSWLARTGSIRRSKRGANPANTGGKRHASAPVGSLPKTSQREIQTSVQEIFGEAHKPRPDVATNLASNRRRNASLPLPSVTCVSSLNLDFATLGLTSFSPSRPRSNHNLNTPGSTLGTQTLGAFPRAVSGERSTLVSSDVEARDGMSVDDEDTDYTLFDSIRTMASMSSSQRVRNVDTPLESMFDESPPSTAGNNVRTKRFSIQEMLGAWEGGTKITEEDESLPTPIRATHLGDPVKFGGVELDVEDSPADSASIAKHLGRPSFDDDDDDGWAQCEESALSNHLSPRSSGVNSRGVSPLRHRLASIGNASPESRHPESFSERPRSNIFDWSEPSTHDRHDPGSHSPRPKTVHGKQEMDLRGGRPTNRKGPTATHVRSQSVPVVAETMDVIKTASAKFGTWNMGSKSASEDWGDDFEFEEVGQDACGGAEFATNVFVTIPAAIQAKQPTVKAHSGQIRELSLLVNDLKRLCRHGRDLDIIRGSVSLKFKEAEDIIALASPDDDDEEDGQGLADSGHAGIEDGFRDDMFDGSPFEQVQGPLDLANIQAMKMAVVREKPANRRYSVLTLEDDIFGGGGPVVDENSRPSRPRTPEPVHGAQDSAVIATVIEAMQLQRATTPGRDASPSKPSNSKLFFDTNSLQELVKRAGQLRDALSDAVRGAELLTPSPAGTPRRERTARFNVDGSPAFTRVFSDPATSPPKRLPKSNSTNSALTRRTSIDSPRMQMMTVQ